MKGLLQELADHTTQAAAGRSTEPARLLPGLAPEALTGGEHSLGVSEQP